MCTFTLSVSRLVPAFHACSATAASEVGPEGVRCYLKEECETLDKLWHGVEPRLSIEEGGTLG